MFCNAWNHKKLVMVKEKSRCCWSTTYYVIMNVKTKPQGLVQVAKIEGLVSCDLGHRFEPCACKLNMLFKWRGPVIPWFWRLLLVLTVGPRLFLAHKNKKIGKGKEISTLYLCVSWYFQSAVFTHRFPIENFYTIDKCPSRSVGSSIVHLRYVVGRCFSSLRLSVDVCE